MAWMNSRFKGRCRQCKEALPVGSRILHIKSPEKMTLCEPCGKDHERKPRHEPPTPYTPTGTPDAMPITPMPSAIDGHRSDDEAAFECTEYRLVDIIEKTNELAKHIDAVAKMKLKRSCNKDIVGSFMHQCSRDNNSWSGKSLEQMRRLLDGSDTLPDLEIPVSTTLDYYGHDEVKRVQCWDADEGELQDWDHLDKARPLRHRKRKHIAIRALEIDVHLSSSSCVSWKDIDRFATRLFGIVRAIESSGVSVGVTACDYTYCSDDSRKLNIGARVRVKDPTEYISPSILRACISAGFFRQHLFTAEVLAMDAKGIDACSTLGRPFHPSIKSGPGWLRIGVGDLNTPESQEQADKAIREALGIAV